jgi:hypothetical protein
MPKYRLLADGMWTGENYDQRAHKGDEVELEDNKRTQSLLDAGAIVSESDATDEQKKLWEENNEASEKKAKDAEEIKAAEEQVASMGGEHDNATKEKNESAVAKGGTPAGAPNVAPKGAK